jgi:hypothetical protein
MALLAVDWRPSTKQLRSFGVIAALFATGIGIWVFLRGSLVGIALGQPAGQILAYAFWGIGAVCLALALVCPKSLWPPYVVFNAAALPIGLVVSFVILSALFYLLFTPVSLVFRLLGRDTLQRKSDCQADSYWVPCETQMDTGRYFRQF